MSPLNHLCCNSPIQLIRQGAAMWTAENRARYDHKTERYPSDMTDEEWQLVEPLLPALRKTRLTAAVNFSTALFMFFEPVANGVRFQKISHRVRQHMIISCACIVMAIWQRSITSSIKLAGHRLRRTSRRVNRPGFPGNRFVGVRRLVLNPPCWRNN